MPDPDDLVSPPPEIEGDAARSVPVTVAQLDAARAFLLTSHDPDKVTPAAVWRHAASVVLARRYPDVERPLSVAPGLVTDFAMFMGVSEAEAAERIAEHLSGEATPLQVHGPRPTAEPGTTDQRDEVSDFLTGLSFADTIGTDTVALFALLRDVADAEPLWPGRGHAGVRCTMCGGKPADNLSPVDHLVSCPWVRVTQVVGVKPPADDVVDAVIYCGAVLADGAGTRLDCDLAEGHPPPHQHGTVTWAELHRGAETDG